METGSGNDFRVLDAWPDFTVRNHRRIWKPKRM